MMVFLLMGLVFSAGCSNRKGVIVTPQGLPGALHVASYSAEGTLAGVKSTSGPQVLQADMVPFTLLIPPGSTGLFAVDLTALGSDQTVIGTGHGEIQIGDGDTYQLSVLMIEMPQATELHGLWGQIPQGLWVVGAGGMAMRYDGEMWNQMVTGRKENLWGVWGSAQDDVWIVGDAGIVLHYVGTASTVVPSGTNVSLYAVWGTGKSDIYAVGAGGIALHWSGSAFTPLPTGTSQTLRGIWGDGKTVWLVGLGGTLLRYDGKDISAQSSGTDRDLYGISGTSAARIFAVGEGGTVLGLPGSATSVLKSGIAEDLWAVWDGGPNDLWLAGASGAVYRYDGTSFTAPPRGTKEDLYAIWGFTGEEDDVFVAGGANTRLRWNQMFFQGTALKGAP